MSTEITNDFKAPATTFVFSHLSSRGTAKLEKELQSRGKRHYVMEVN